MTAVGFWLVEALSKKIKGFPLTFVFNIGKSFLIFLIEK